jgi:hypothetical protein
MVAGGFLGRSFLILLSCCVCFSLAVGQDKPEERLAKLKEGKNKYRGGVGSSTEAQKEMAKLFDKIMISGEGGAEKDKWYSPHLRDLGIEVTNRFREAVNTRGQTAPRDKMGRFCKLPWPEGVFKFLASGGSIFDIEPEAGGIVFNIDFATGKIKAACEGPSCTWHGDGTDHRPEVSCTRDNTRAYRKLWQPSNFKTCCVLAAEREWTSEQIAATHEKGDGWAGLFEYYYPVTAVGWENDRTTTMIVEKDKVTECKNKSEPLMHNSQAANWVAGAIERGAKYASEGSSDGAGKDGEVKGKVLPQIQQNIGDLKPKDEDLQMADSLDDIGLTVRVNLATMDPAHRKKAAQRFCMRDEQFDKLMDPNFVPDGKYRDSPTGDPTQLPPKTGGGDVLGNLINLPIWSNYCEEGVMLMTKPENSSQLINFDKTPSNFVQGMTAWMRDPRYCQKMNLENQSIQKTGFNKAIEGQGANSSWNPSEEEVGYACRKGGKLNGGAVPVAIGRHAPVERRTVIGDQVYAMLHSARLAPGMHEENKSYLKGYDDRPYSNLLPDLLTKPFIGERFRGGGTNELGKACPGLSGQDYQGEPKGDKLYLSDVTHAPFDQKQVWEATEGDGESGINRYAQEWAKDEQSGKEIAKRGLDDKSQNYATAFRFFATCPANFVRWRPKKDKDDAHTLENLNNYCKEEYFGGLPNPADIPGPRP